MRKCILHARTCQHDPSIEDRHEEGRLVDNFTSMKSFKNVFVTVGTTRFDDLISALLSEQVLEVRIMERFDHCITYFILQSLSRLGCQELVIQAGRSKIPIHSGTIRVSTYEYKESIAEDISCADLVIGHSGTRLNIGRLMKE